MNIKKITRVAKPPSSKSKTKAPSNVNICVNRKAKFNYTIKQTYEAGVALIGNEIKAIKQFGMNIEESYIKIEKGEAFIVGSNIKEYLTSSGYSAKRDRKLLLRKNQIIGLFSKNKETSHTIIPISVYFSGRKNLVKISIAVAEGKKLHDKRQTIREKEWNRKIEIENKNTKIEIR